MSLINTSKFNGKFYKYSQKKTKQNKIKTSVERYNTKNLVNQLVKNIDPLILIQWILL